MTALLAAILAFQAITVSSNTVPGALVTVSGQKWTDTAVSAYPQNALSLAGYSVTLGGTPCLIQFVDSTNLMFLVPDGTAPGLHVVTVAGPAGAFSANVVVVEYQPHLVERNGFVVAQSARLMFPLLYVDGAAIPVSPTTFNLLTVQATGIPTSYTSEATVILDGPQHYELPARTYPVIGLTGVTNVGFFGPSCADGDYSIIVEVGGKRSQAGVIRFEGDCTVGREGFERLRVLR